MTQQNAPCWTKAQQAAPERIAFVLIDGLADIQIPALGNLTPLEAANTPTMDAIAGLVSTCFFQIGIWQETDSRHTKALVSAAAGLNGLLDPVEPGLACGSDTAHLSIFGYDPRM